MSTKSKLKEIMSEAAIKLLTERGGEGATVKEFCDYAMLNFGNEMAGHQNEALRLLLSTFFNKLIKPSAKAKSGQVDMLINGTPLPLALPIPSSNGTFKTKLTTECTIGELIAHNNLVLEHSHATFAKYQARLAVIASALETAGNDESWTIGRVLEANRNIQTL